MTDNTTPTRRVAVATVKRHYCADHGCLAAMLGVEVIEATAGDAEEGSSSN
jgi:hypothetical protein